PLRRSASVANAVEPALDVAFVSQLHQVSRLPAVSADDPRAGALGPGGLRPTAGTPGPPHRRLWPGAVFLLPVAHPAHPRRRRAVRLAAFWLVAVGEQRSLVPPRRHPRGLRRRPADGVSRLG